MPPAYSIDLSKKFPPLANAPIVEAAVQWVIEPSKQFDMDSVGKTLEEKFPKFNLSTINEIETQISDSPAGELNLNTTVPRVCGFRLEHDEYVCQFKNDSVLFSRLAPYEDWPTFHSHGKPFFNLFESITKPKRLERIGVRYISRIALQANENADAYIHAAKRPLGNIGLTSDSFFHQDIANLAELFYQVQLRRLVQPPQPPMSTSRSLIVDIDVHSTNVTPMDEDVITRRMSELRFLKNEVFFSFMKNPESNFN